MGHIGVGWGKRGTETTLSRLFRHQQNNQIKAKNVVSLAKLKLRQNKQLYKFNQLVFNDFSACVCVWL